MKQEVEITFLSGKVEQFDCIGVEVYDDTAIFYDEGLDVNGMYPVHTVHIEDIDIIKVRIKGVCNENIGKKK